MSMFTFSPRERERERAHRSTGMSTRNDILSLQKGAEPSSAQLNLERGKCRKACIMLIVFERRQSRCSSRSIAIYEPSSNPFERA